MTDQGISVDKAHYSWDIFTVLLLRDTFNNNVLMMGYKYDEITDDTIGVNYCR